MPAAVFTAVALLLLLTATPIFIAVLAPTMLALEIFGPPIPSMILAQRAVEGINKFSLLAIPLFLFAAEIISRGQIGTRLLAMMESLIGHITGGLAIATVLACALFGAISGIGAAAVVSIGPIVYPSLLRQGYSRGFSVGLILSASTLAMLIPPSVAMILYSLQTNTSVGAVFLSGLAAGLIFTAALAAYAYVYARWRGIGSLPRQPLGAMIKSVRRAFWAIGFPVIIFGGIYGGVFTPTEAAASACIYAMVVETLIYRQLKVRELFHVANESAVVIATLLILIAAGSAMTYYLTLQGVPQALASILGGSERFVVLLLINVIFLVAGMLVDPNSAIIVLSPLVFPAALAAGVEPIHLGAVIVMNIAIGMITPPFGLNIFIGMATFRVGYGEIVRSVLPFIGIAILALIVVTYAAQATQWLPVLAGFRIS